MSETNYFHLKSNLAFVLLTTRLVNEKVRSARNDGRAVVHVALYAAVKLCVDAVAVVLAHREAAEGSVEGRLSGNEAARDGAVRGARGRWC
jgi:hypothetical protein